MCVIARTQTTTAIPTPVRAPAHLTRKVRGAAFVLATPTVGHGTRAVRLVTAIILAQNLASVTPSRARVLARTGMMESSATFVVMVSTTSPPVCHAPVTMPAPCLRAATKTPVTVLAPTLANASARSMLLESSASVAPQAHSRSRLQIRKDAPSASVSVSRMYVGRLNTTGETRCR